MTILRVQKLSENATVPSRYTRGSIGYDLHSSEDTTIQKRKRRCVETDLLVFAPPGTYIRIAPRSGLSVRGIDIGAGVVDPDYEGAVKVVVINNSPRRFTIKKGDRIAQLICEKCDTPKVEVIDNVSYVDCSSQNIRGTDSFGSTGK